MGSRSMKLRAFVASACLAVALTAATAASAGSIPVVGGAFATVNPTVDGNGKCLYAFNSVSCNLYAGKGYAWLNGADLKGKLTDGKWFYAILAPGIPTPNDGGLRNLSDDFGPYTNRTFTVVNGSISSYTGTNDLDSGIGAGPRLPDRTPPQIRLYPYADTNFGGIYLMALCYIGPTGTSYPVDWWKCKYDAYKAPFADVTPPNCVLTATGTNAQGAKYIQVTVQDPKDTSDSGSGIENIVIDEVHNANVTVPDYTVGTMSPITVTATKANPAQGSFLKLSVTNVAGLTTVCDPIFGATAKHSALKPLLLLRRGGR